MKSNTVCIQVSTEQNIRAYCLIVSEIMMFCVRELIIFMYQRTGEIFTRYSCKNNFHNFRIYSRLGISRRYQGFVKLKNYKEDKSVNDILLSLTMGVF